MFCPGIFQAQKPNGKWVTDITYVETPEGRLFVAAIIDLFSRKVWLFDG
ncbi:MAG: DDE-type integrase/transposase/recombinase [Thermoguttaceae bacterium]